MTRNGLDHFHRFLPAAVAAVAGIKVFITVSELVGHRHHVSVAQILAVGNGGFRDVHALRDSLVHGANFTIARDRITIRRDKGYVGKQDVTDIVRALHQQAGGDPTTSIGPPCHSGRAQQVLPQRRGDIVEIRHAWHFLQAQFTIGGNSQLHRAFDARAHGSRAVKVFRQKNRFQQRRDFVTTVTEQGPQLLL